MVSNPHAYFLRIPNQFVSILLGSQGDTIKHIKEISQVHNLHLSPDCEPN